MLSTEIEICADIMKAKKEENLPETREGTLETSDLSQMTKDESKLASERAKRKQMAQEPIVTIKSQNLSLCISAVTIFTEIIDTSGWKWVGGVLYTS